jgi:glutathione peroxidase-family protein
VTQAWGIGSSLEPDGSIGHTLHSFLVDSRGYVVARYSSRDRDPDAIRREIELFAQAKEPGVPQVDGAR